MCTGRTQCLLPCQRSCEYKTFHSFSMYGILQPFWFLWCNVFSFYFFLFQIKIEAKKKRQNKKENLKQKHPATLDHLIAAAMFVVCHRREQDADPGCRAVLSDFILAFFLLWWPLFLTLFLLGKINLDGSDSLSILVWILCQVGMGNWSQWST